MHHGSDLYPPPKKHCSLLINPTPGMPDEGTRAPRVVWPLGWILLGRSSIEISGIYCQGNVFRSRPSSHALGWLQQTHAGWHNVTAADQLSMDASSHYAKTEHQLNWGESFFSVWSGEKHISAWLSAFGAGQSHFFQESTFLVLKEDNYKWRRSMSCVRALSQVGLKQSLFQFSYSFLLFSTAAVLSGCWCVSVPVPPILYVLFCIVLKQLFWKGGLNIY